MPLVDDLLMLLADAAAASPSDWEDLTTWEAQAREEETGEDTLHSVALQLMADIASMVCSSCSLQDPGAEGGSAEAGASSTGGHCCPFAFAAGARVRIASAVSIMMYSRHLA